MLPASIRRIIGRQRRSTFKCLPSPQTEEFEVPYDEIATIYLKKNIIRKLMIRRFWTFSREILKLYRCSKIVVIASVIELRMIQLKAIFQAKAITYLAAAHWCFLFFVLWAHNTFPLRFWFFSFVCHFSQKMSFNQPWNCVFGCLLPRYTPRLNSSRIFRKQTFH